MKTQTQLSNTLATTESRGLDAADLKQVFDRVEALATEKTVVATGITESMRAEAAAEHAEAVLVEQLNEEARALEIENQERLIKFALRDGTIGAVAFTFGKLITKKKTIAKKVRK